MVSNRQWRFRVSIGGLLVDDAMNPFDPAHPDSLGSLKIPPSPQATPIKPEGK